MYYLYRHIRLDKNEVFYIGIGKINKSTGKFGKDHHRSFKIYQYSLNNEFIKVWGSMSDIKRELDFNISHISLCVNNKKPTAYKFKWFRERI